MLHVECCMLPVRVRVHVRVYVHVHVHVRVHVRVHVNVNVIHISLALWVVMNEGFCMRMLLALAGLYEVKLRPFFILFRTAILLLISK